MYTQYEDKGKIFTQKITKEQKEVIIQTTSHKISGTIHIQMDNRIIDELNETNQFMALTDAKILDPVENVLYQAEFLSINVNQIIWVLPVEDKIK
ncbi:MAG TPA: hypothetical protein VK856_13185 [Anaerolineaceae bacterium]|nr:hypothetical protein [Anaerolineaceae bacterium]